MRWGLREWPLCYVQRQGEALISQIEACLHLLEELSSFCVDWKPEFVRVFERLLKAFVFYQLKAILIEREVFTTTPYIMDSDGVDIPRAPLVGTSSCKKRGRSTAMPVMIIELSIDL